MGARDYREPDVAVVREEELDTVLVPSRQVLLAVEVMSPSSVTDDRLVTPAQYARAGVAHYWRLELGVALLTYALDGDVHRETGRSTDQEDVREPVPLPCRLGELTGPR